MLNLRGESVDMGAFQSELKIIDDRDKPKARSRLLAQKMEGN
jgi:hypothetical protein